MDTKELYAALALLEKERGISVDYMLSQIQRAIVVACKNTYGGNEDVTVIMDKENEDFQVFLNKEVVEEVFDPNCEISLEAARDIKADYEIGDKVGFKLDPKEFGRIAINTSRSIIRQGIRDGEKGQMLQEFQSKHQELVTATVERVDGKNGAVTLKIGKAEAVLPRNEQVGNENFKEGDHVKIYIADVQESERGPRVLISRTHPDFVKRLFETEVPEIYDGTVEIKSVSREAGSRTKLAVWSKDSDVDAVGACIGARGARVGTIVNELGGEKIDIVEYDEDPAKFIAAALSPATVLSVVVAEDGSKQCKVTVPDGQLSLAIGNKGQNARLAARLTGWKIDIRPESGFYGEDDDETFAVKKQSDEAASESDDFTEDMDEE
ncbi:MULTISPECIES: transcription termination factor NusA [unclassified Ruminococcus]|uniref:transcription termination factor NusA n=1 Tax=unclassified Ruminococcus TaxID=2608920 RepID=UPI002109050B|nr:MULTISPECIES: transcription termination factor NusA [unclassified Ruminococcus]MCQ4021977.1 transcription termination/antitermination protein NusA [Ruminococcus sp. zg-924]MCQ4114513.1 transcription termination/antitermination protein NusA [Ruminococcus sp. zg-921]